MIQVTAPSEFGIGEQGIVQAALEAVGANQPIASPLRSKVGGRKLLCAVIFLCYMGKHRAELPTEGDCQGKAGLFFPTVQAELISLRHKGKGGAVTATEEMGKELRILCFHFPKPSVKNATV